MVMAEMAPEAVVTEAMAVVVVAMAVRVAVTKLKTISVWLTTHQWIRTSAYPTLLSLVAAVVIPAA